MKDGFYLTPTIFRFDFVQPALKQRPFVLHGLTSEMGGEMRGFAICRLTGGAGKLFGLCE